MVKLNHFEKKINIEYIFILVVISAIYRRYGTLPVIKSISDNWANFLHRRPHRTWTDFPLRSWTGWSHRLFHSSPGIFLRVPPVLESHLYSCYQKYPSRRFCSLVLMSLFYSPHYTMPFALPWTKSSSGVSQLSCRSFHILQKSTCFRPNLQEALLSAFFFVFHFINITGTGKLGRSLERTTHTINKCTQVLQRSERFWTMSSNAYKSFSTKVT